MSDPAPKASPKPPQPQPYPSSIPTATHKSPRIPVSVPTTSTNDSDSKPNASNPAPIEPPTIRPQVLFPRPTISGTDSLDSSENPFYEHGPATPQKSLKQLSRASSGGRSGSHLPVPVGKQATGSSKLEDVLLAERSPLVPQNQAPRKRDVTPQQSLKLLSRITPPVNPTTHPLPPQPLFSTIMRKSTTTDPSDPFTIIDSSTPKPDPSTTRTDRTAATFSFLDDERPPEGFDFDLASANKTFRNRGGIKSLKLSEDSLFGNEGLEKEEEVIGHDGGIYQAGGVDEDVMGMEEDVVAANEDTENQEGLVTYDEEQQEEPMNEDSRGWSCESVDLRVTSPLRRFRKLGSEEAFGEHLQDSAMHGGLEGSFAVPSASELEQEEEEEEDVVIGNEDAFVAIADSKACDSMGMFEGEEGEEEEEEGGNEIVPPTDGEYLLSLPSENNALDADLSFNDDEYSHEYDDSDLIHQSHQSIDLTHSSSIELDDGVESDNDTRHEEDEDVRPSASHSHFLETMSPEKREIKNQLE
ncbi:hypothetical protein HK097_010990, partial [Rhizophlyctis rosea]